VWEDFQRTLAYLHKTGDLPEGYRSHDHLNELSEVAVNSTVLDRWKAKFARLDQEERARGIEVVWCLIDGFVLYWDEVRSTIITLNNDGLI
jgi:nicotinamide/nicotinate riboside kinase